MGYDLGFLGFLWVLLGLFIVLVLISFVDFYVLVVGDCMGLFGLWGW